LENHVATKITGFIQKIEELIVAFILVAILAFSMLQIILRNFFDSGIIWGESLLRILVLWLALGGAVLASHQNKQINIDVLSRHIAEKYQHIVHGLSNLFTAVICFIIAWYSLLFVIDEYQVNSYAFENVPAWITESIIPVAFLLMSIRYLLKLFFREAR